MDTLVELAVVELIGKRKSLKVTEDDLVCKMNELAPGVKSYDVSGETDRVAFDGEGLTRDGETFYKFVKVVPPKPAPKVHWDRLTLEEIQTLNKSNYRGFVGDASFLWDRLCAGENDEYYSECHTQLEAMARDAGCKLRVRGCDCAWC